MTSTPTAPTPEPVPATMRAVLLTRHGGPEVLEHAEVPTPRPAAGEVLVRVSAAALNNTDVWTRQGAYGTAQDPEALAGWLGEMDLPRIQGGDVAGVVVAVGEGVDAGMVGRRVVLDPATYHPDRVESPPIAIMGSESDGGYAQYVRVPAERAHDVTGSPLTDDQLAALPIAYGTALGMLERGRQREGETVLVSGASGGVGLALVQLARARGARVIALASPGKAEAVCAAGAHAVVPRSDSLDIAEAVAARAPDGIDVVLDVVAGDLLSGGLPMLAPGARWVVAGALGGYAISLDVRRLYLTNASIVGSTMHTREHFALLMEMARRGQVAPVIAGTYPLAEAARAQADLERRAHVGKLVLHP